MMLDHVRSRYGIVLALAIATSLLTKRVASAGVRLWLLLTVVAARRANSEATSAIWDAETIAELCAIVYDLEGAQRCCMSIKVLLCWK